LSSYVFFSLFINLPVLIAEALHRQQFVLLNFYEICEANFSEESARDMKHRQHAAALLCARASRLPLVFVDCQLAQEKGKMKGSTRSQKMDEPFNM
jgi:hypothetical protein